MWISVAHTGCHKRWGSNPGPSACKAGNRYTYTTKNTRSTVASVNSNCFYINTVLQRCYSASPLLYFLPLHPDNQTLRGHRGVESCLTGKEPKMFHLHSWVFKKRWEKSFHENHNEVHCQLSTIWSFNNNFTGSKNNNKKVNKMM